jgi:acyl carrier protein
MDLRDELLRLLEASGASLPQDLDDNTSLIESGVLDSTALFSLVLWIDERVAPGLDLTALNLSEEWSTLAKLLAFIDRHVGTTGPQRP